MKKTKLNFKCPLCGRLLYEPPYSNDQSWSKIKNEGGCILLCPERENSSCSIFCYFFCGELKIEINYRNVLELLDHDDPRVAGCEKFIKIYREIFENAFSSISVSKSFEI